MTDQDRGAYTPPTDAPLSFDPRRPVRGSQPIPLTLVLSGAVLLLLVAAIIVFYRSGVREAGEAPAVVGQPVGPISQAPPPEAQPVDPAANLQIYKGDDSASSAPTFTPPPEAPQPRVAVAPLPPPAPAPTASASAGLKPAQSAPPPAPPAPKPAQVAVAKPPAAAPPATGSFGVQIGAFSSRALADKGYADAGRITGVDIAGKTKRIEEIEKNGSILFRTTVVGFTSRTQAAEFCGQLKAAGKACFVK